VFVHVCAPVRAYFLPTYYLYRSQAQSKYNARWIAY